MHELSVRLHDQPIGVLQQDNAGKMMFRYIDGNEKLLSLSMPETDGGVYGDQYCEAFFGGLLPENYQARVAIGKRFGINPNNSFSLLRAIGYDCAGAVSLHSAEDTDAGVIEHTLQGRLIDDDELAKHIRDLPRRPLFVGVDGIRISLAGAQDKAAVILIDNKIAFPLHGCPTTHILKPAGSDFDALILNEFFCMRLAKRIGLNVPNVEFRRVEDIDYLLIERYDRKLLAGNRIKRIHQEDFCQALGVVPKLKYQADGGPSFVDCFSLLTKTTRPATDRNSFASAIVFNYLIGNRDAHGKNFSLLHVSDDEIKLAPFYDLLSTNIYEGLDHKMAMKIGNHYVADDFYPRHWQSLCKEAGFGYSNLRKMIEQQSSALVAAAQAERDAVLGNISDSNVPNMIIQWLEDITETTIKRLDNAPQQFT